MAKLSASGAPSHLQNANTITAQYLRNEKVIEIPKKRRQGNGNFLELKGCTGNNLKNISIKIPLGKMVGITGVSGSGKSSLINENSIPNIKTIIILMV